MLQNNDSKRKRKSNNNIKDIDSQLFWHLFSRRVGGQTRLNIINLLFRDPSNKSQIGKKLKKDYKVVRHHLEILEKNNLVTKIGNGYGSTYFISTYFISKEKEYRKIVKKIKSKTRKNRKIICA